MTANTHEKILEVRGLTKTYGGVKKKGAKQPTPTLDVLKGIDIDIYRGDVVCLIGPSGCGKSTFLRCLNRLEIPTSGSIKFEGVEVDDAHIDAVRQKMGMVFQHFNLFPHLTVKKNLELAPSLLKLKDKEAISQRADELLARVGLADKRDAYPSKLSGGQKQRVGIARAIALNPKFVVLDESVSALDVSVQAQILQLLDELRDQQGLTYFFITHNLGVVKHFCDRVMVMYLGNLCELSPSHALFDKPLHPYTRGLLAAIPENYLPERGFYAIPGVGGDPRKGTGCRFAPRCGQACQRCREQAPRLAEAAPGHRVSCFLYGKDGESDG